ncbi:hypothetical protein [Nonomuraea jiangxiensis]|uniref:Cupredoxin-like domain-containing protein n=1 Tax=Nonomuraea jiangxiensis TaxID=633440 RepID=A0A1G8I4P6_9ACTN|nr:hypothetical protein [Nonomuraea jiangxiensis]SDI13802.1 hypothetical protein SAMN05421869_104372 [Nonomuraea jiangxiensis]
MSVTPRSHHSPRPFVALLVLLLTGPVACAAEAPAATAPGTETVKTITVSIAGGTVTPAPGRIEVARGQAVRLTVTSDVSDMVHVHGYDKSATLLPGIAASVGFAADVTGLFEVETHEQDLQLFQLLVR